MALFTLISRLYDGMPLVADTESDPSVGEEAKATAAAICRRLATDPRIPRDTPALILSDPPSHLFFVLCSDDISCLALCDTAAAPTAAFAYLDELFSEFTQLYAPRVQLASRPYSFISFDVCIQRTKKLYVSSGSVVKRMPRRMASMPAPRRAAVEELLELSPKRRGSSLYSTPTVMEPQRLLSASPTKELGDEFSPKVVNRESAVEEVVFLVQEHWPWILLTCLLVAILIVVLFFLIAYLFE